MNMNTARKMVMQERHRAGLTLAEIGMFFGVSKQAVHQAISRGPPLPISESALRELDYMRRSAPKRGGYMYEGARPAFEKGEYQDSDLQELLFANLIAPHEDPAKGWVVIAADYNR